MEGEALYAVSLQVACMVEVWGVEFEGEHYILPFCGSS